MRDFLSKMNGSNALESMPLSQKLRAVGKFIELDFNCRDSKAFNEELNQSSPKETKQRQLNQKQLLKHQYGYFHKRDRSLGLDRLLVLPCAFIPTASAYEGGMLSKAWAPSFSHPNLSLPKISAPGWKSFPASRRTVRTTILSPMMVW